MSIHIRVRDILLFRERRFRDVGLELLLVVVLLDLRQQLRAMRARQVERRARHQQAAGFACSCTNPIRAHISLHVKFVKSHYFNKY